MDRTDEFLRELTDQQEREPDRAPSGRSVADALGLDTGAANYLLEGLLEGRLIKVIPTTPRYGDAGLLDELIEISAEGRVALERSAEHHPSDGLAFQFLRALGEHLEGRNQTRVGTSAVAQALRLDREATKRIVDELLDARLIQTHPASRPRLAGGSFSDQLELTDDGRHALTCERYDRVGSRPGEPLPETYSTRDLPVLTEAARVLDSQAGAHGLKISQLVDATGLTLGEVELALRALESEGLLQVRWVHPRPASRVSHLSGEARRLVKLWPTPETAFDRMIAALELIAENSDQDDDTRTRARKILDGFGGAGKQIGISVASAVLSGQIQ